MNSGNMGEMRLMVLVLALTALTIIVMSSTVALAIPTQHYFRSIDVRYSGAGEDIYYSLENLGMLVDIDEDNAYAAILGRYNTNGAFYVALYNINTDTLSKVVYFQNQTQSYRLNPTSVNIQDNYLIITLKDSNGYSYLIKMSLPDLSIEWAIRTNASLLDTCVYNNVLYAVADPPVSSGGIAIMMIDPSDGSFQGYSYKKHWSYYNIVRARMYCTPSGMIIVGHESRSYFFIETYDYSSQHYAWSYNGIDFIVQELVYNPSTNELYAIGSGRYDDFNADSYHDPVVLAINAADALSGNTPLEWAVVMHNSDDQHYAFFGGALHDGPGGQWLGLVGMFQFATGTSDHAFFALINLTEATKTVSNIIEVPAAPSYTTPTYTRGGYVDLYEENGYVWAFGFTWYVDDASGDRYNLGIAFISNGINDTLKWSSTPEGVSWPDVYVVRHDPNSISQDYITSFASPEIPYMTDGTIDNLVWNNIIVTGTDITSSVTIYEAADESSPLPIPEPWYLAAAVVAVLALMLWRSRS